MPGESAGTTVSRTIRILNCLAQDINRIADICSHLGFSKSTVHRLLKTLEANGFVIQNPANRSYYLGPLFVDLATKPLTAHKVLILTAENELEQLRELSRETVILHIPLGLSRVCLSEFESPQVIKYTAGIGSVAPIHVGSAGKLLLAKMDQSDLQIILNNLRMEPIGPNTITSKEALLKEVAKVKETGFAISMGERLAYAVSISVPIDNYICPVSLSILGPEDRFKPVLTDTLPAMKKAAQKISQKIKTHFHNQPGSIK